MNMKIKKMISALAITGVLVVGLTPRTSSAGVGGVLSIAGGAGLPIMVVGGAVLTTGLGIGLIPSEGCGKESFFCFHTKDIVAALMDFAGLVILDSNDHHGVAFSALSEKDANTLGVSDEQALAYNNELDELNAIRDEVTARLLESKKPTLEMSQAAWNELKTQVSPKAYTVVEKISQKMLSNLQTQRLDDKTTD